MLKDGKALQKRIFSLHNSTKLIFLYPDKIANYETNLNKIEG